MLMLTPRGGLRLASRRGGAAAQCGCRGELMRCPWALATDEPTPSRRTRGAAFNTVADRAASGGVKPRGFACTPTVLATFGLLVATVVMFVLCPMLYRARLAKRAARRAQPSYSFELLLHPVECREIVNAVQSLDLFVDGRTGGGGGHSVRRSRVARLPRGEFDWVYARVQAGIAMANTKAWDYSSIGDLEELQVAKYESHVQGDDGHYTCT